MNGFYTLGNPKKKVKLQTSSSTKRNIGSNGGGSSGHRGTVPSASGSFQSSRNPRDRGVRASSASSSESRKKRKDRIG